MGYKARRTLSRKGRVVVVELCAALGLCILALVINCTGCGNRQKHGVPAPVRVPEPVRMVYYRAEPLAYASVFNILNDAHLEAARRFGLESMPDSRETVVSAGLMKIGSGDLYVVDTLKYSVPFLVPHAAMELDRIGRSFQSLLSSESLPAYRFIVTSVLRTRDDVERLGHVNVNSSGNSAHCYGTTWDISWSRFDKVVEGGDTMVEGDLKLALAKVLQSEQEAGRILVKYERKQACFHITVNY